MEGFIIMIIVFAISSLLNKNKEQSKKQTKPMPPFSSQPAPRKQDVQPTQQNRPKTLEDFANEVFGQLNEKAKPFIQKAEQPLEVPLPKPEPVQEVVERKKIVEKPRMATERPLVRQLEQQTEGLQVVPQNNKELMQAFVMSEILGPPKARKK